MGTRDRANARATSWACVFANRRGLGGTVSNCVSQADGAAALWNRQHSALPRRAARAHPGFAELKKQGIHIVVNLRHEPDEIARERGLVEQQGMGYVSIPWRGKQDPKTEQVAQFLELLRANPNKKVFVHCERGAERTGVMVACYRMSSEQWTPEQALNEMEAFRFRGLRFGHLKKFVRAFPGLLLNDPFLKTLAQPSSLP